MGMNANGRTLLANWVEERATLHIDSDVDRKDILKRGHKNIITGEPYQGAKTTTHATYYTQPQPKPKEAGATSLSKLRYEQALFEVLEETEREEGNQSKEQIPLFQDHHLHQLMEFNGFKRNQLVFGLNYTQKNELMDAQLVKHFRNQPNSQLQSFTKWMTKITTFHISKNNNYYFYS